MNRQAPSPRPRTQRKADLRELAELKAENLRLRAELDGTRAELVFWVAVALQQGRTKDGED